jgi:acetyl esterase/lipase
VAPDFECTGVSTNGIIDWIHRKTDEGDIYFVSSRWQPVERVECSFRVSGKIPELWDPVTGEIQEAGAFRQENGRTIVPLKFNPFGSVFVVFRKPTTETKRSGQNWEEFQPMQEIAGPWTVNFDPQWGGPPEATFTTLEGWTMRSESGIKYYSGKATYRKTFNLSSEPKAKTYLDLGDVRELASVRLNGQDLGVFWTKPFRIEVTHALKPGDNQLEIDVVNLWPNRLIGDTFLPKEKRVTRTNMAKYTQASQLLPSGLLGPVKLLRACIVKSNPPGQETERVPLPLWPNPPPGERSGEPEAELPDRGDNVRRITNIQQPSITVFPAGSSNKSSPAVVVCPGGGYGILAIDKEGMEVATWLNRIGITAVLLKYRVPQNREGAFMDAQRAIRLVRHHAAEWNIDPKRVGMIGFSAGGHLTARLSTGYEQRAYPEVDVADKQSCRPDFAVLIYPAYLADKQGRLASELMVTPQTPPTFLIHTKDDQAFVTGSAVYDQALKHNGVASEFHLFDTGGHGYGLRPSTHEVSNWPELCGKWLQKKVGTVPEK